MSPSRTHVRKQYAAGRERFVDDVLLQEMSHQHQDELVGDRDHGYHGHGPVFRDTANRIGADALSRIDDMESVSANP